MPTVREYLTKRVVTIAPEASAKAAFGLMKSRGIRHLVVVKEGVTLGIVTDRDLRRPNASDVFKSWDEVYRLTDEFQAEDVMTSPVVTIDAQADVREAARILVERRIGALPVTDAHRGLPGSSLKPISCAPSSSAPLADHAWHAGPSNAHASSSAAAERPAFTRPANPGPHTLQEPSRSASPIWRDSEEPGQGGALPSPAASGPEESAPKVEPAYV